MGANQSTRKITVVNDEAAGVIKISDAVVQRLRGEIAGDPPSTAASPAAAPAPAAPAPPPVEVVLPEAPAAEPPQAAPQDHALPPQHIWQRPIIQYIEEPSLSALRVRTEKEEELLALENYWKERLAAQEAETVHRQKLTEQEVAGAAKKVEELFRPAQQEAAKPCKDFSADVQSCYSSNPSQPLMCRDKVAQFSQCVVDWRSQILKA